jgi:hypothetical protein
VPYPLQMMRDVKFYLQESFGMEVLSVLKSSGTMLKVIMDQLAQVTYLIVLFRLLNQ